MERRRRSTPRRRRTEVELGVADGRQDPKQAVVAIDDQSRVTTKTIDMQPAVDIEEGEFVDGRRTQEKIKVNPLNGPVIHWNISRLTCQ